MKMTDIMKKSHSESKSENLDAILQKIDNKAFITNSADSAHTETKPQPIKLCFCSGISSITSFSCHTQY